MIKYIQAHVDSCSFYQREKMQADKYQLQTADIPKRAFADLIVELPTSHYSNKNILVIVDHLTRWPIAKAIPDRESTTGANAISEKLILKHGEPEVLSDNGKEFTNDTLAYGCQEFNIEQHFTSPYTPRSNRKLCQEDTTAWDQVLVQILFVYRCCPHTSTGEVSYTLLYNRDPPLLVQNVIWNSFGIHSSNQYSVIALKFWLPEFPHWLQNCCAIF